MLTNLRADGEDTILEPGGQLDNVSAIESRPPVDIDKQLDSIIAQACTNAIAALMPSGNYPLNVAIIDEAKAQLKTLIAEQVAAAEQQLLTELLGELPKTQPAFGEQMYPGKHDKDNLRKYGFNECLTQVVSVIERKIGELNG